MDKFRKCKGKYYFQGKYHEFELGYFHQWGNGFEEFEDGVRNYSIAIVELPDGKVVTPEPNEIVFLIICVYCRNVVKKILLDCSIFTFEGVQEV